ncbi:MAG: enoyl-CoA hydratase/isomerase family protein [Defluviitaleaceae bacterium]|nr:enoyl-CoA hydratase/isomerase family protein [Defluviitaleaceae bacterium]
MVHVESKGYVRTIKLEREEKHNAMTPQMSHDLYDIAKELNADKDCRVVVLTGGKKAFCSGSDIKELVQYETPWDFRVREKDYPDAIRIIRKPVIAMINGYCLGGGLEMAISADIRYASKTAKLGTPEVNWGWIGGGGASQLLPRMIGPGKAAEMLLSGRHYTAEEAYRMGLVDALAETPDELEAMTYALAEEIGSKAPLATQVIKKAVRVSMNTGLDVGLEYENELVYLTFSTEDKLEGEAAFREKRKPEFKGR